MDLFIIVKAHNLRYINYGFEWDHFSNPGGESYSTDHVLHSSSDGTEQGSEHCQDNIAIIPAQGPWIFLRIQYEPNMMEHQLSGIPMN